MTSSVEGPCSTLRNVSRKANDKHLAILFDGQVLSAPLIMNPITTSRVTLAFGTATLAKQIVVQLGGSATP